MSTLAKIFLLYRFPIPTTFLYDDHRSLRVAGFTSTRRKIITYLLVVAVYLKFEIHLDI